MNAEVDVIIKLKSYLKETAEQLLSSIHKAIEIAQAEVGNDARKRKRTGVKTKCVTFLENSKK
jgi:hypothetical protein